MNKLKAFAQFNNKHGTKQSFNVVIFRKHKHIPKLTMTFSKTSEYVSGWSSLETLPNNGSYNSFLMEFIYE